MGDILGKSKDKGHQLNLYILVAKGKEKTKVEYKEAMMHMALVVLYKQGSSRSKGKYCYKMALKLMENVQMFVKY
eukprot:7823542-Prorocentrum_lima.AAC.1